MKIKLQNAELNDVHSAVSPAAPKLDFEWFARELYMHIKHATGIEREVVAVELRQRPFKQ